MGKLDALTKKYLSQNEVFADAFNYLIFDGKPVIDPNDLAEQDPEEIAVIRKLGRVITNQKMRDLLKICTIRHSKSATLVLLGIEGQANIHYAMPVKDNLYDALNYAAQVENAKRIHQENKDTINSAEFLSGFTKEDRLIPVITLCICFDKAKWDSPKSLYEMFGDMDPQIQKYVNNYQLNLITPSEVEDFSKFASELGIVLEFIKNSEDKHKIHDIINTNERYRHVDISSVDMINAYTSANISKAGAEGGQVNMCTAIKELMEDSRMEGRMEGREEGRMEGREEGRMEGREEGRMEGRMQGREEGRMEGRMEGHIEGRVEGEHMMANLILKLTPDTDEYKIALLGTSEEREGLYKKYGITK